MDARDKIKFLLKDKAVLAYKYRLNSHKVTINIIVGLVTLCVRTLSLVQIAANLSMQHQIER
jgi:hypothetical protein